jgi:hypothetical protein
MVVVCNSKNNDDVCNFSFLLQCSFVAYSMCFELVSHTLEVFFMDVALLWERIQSYGKGE